MPPEYFTNNEIFNKIYSLLYLEFIASSNNSINIRTLESKFNVDQVDSDFKSLINKLFDFKIELQNQQSKILQGIYWFRIPK